MRVLEMRPNPARQAVAATLACVDAARGGALCSGKATSFLVGPAATGAWWAKMSTPLIIVAGLARRLRASYTGKGKSRDNYRERYGQGSLCPHR